MDRDNHLDRYIRAAINDARSLHSVLDDLVDFRKSLKITQKELGRRMNVTQAAISALESENSNPRVESLQKYARALDAKLNFSIDYLKYAGTDSNYFTQSDYVEYFTESAFAGYENLDNRVSTS